MIDIRPISTTEGIEETVASLDSTPGGHREYSRWSYAPAPPILLLRHEPTDGGASLRSARQILRRWIDPLEALHWLAEHCRARPLAGPPFKGGWIGYLGYDVGRYFETLPARAVDDLRLPLFQFTFHDRVVATNHETGKIFEVRCGHDFDPAPLAEPAALRTAEQPLVSSFSRDGYESAVRRAIEYIAAGDIFQVNLSQRFTAALREPPQNIYERLRQQSPAWFGAFLRYADCALMCNSPELFLRVTPTLDGSRSVLTRPIKGTRPRAAGMESALRESLKDQAELNMIVDLERNDLGRVCEIGSVKVLQPREIEAHPTVYHGVATIAGQLRRDVGFVELLRATFPGGSVTGAPKIRAMQIIDELEPTRRGPYCGAIGYLSVDGHIEFNIAIRTMIVQDGRVHMPVGGAVVADSDPAAEYEETLVKARAMFAAVGLPRGPGA